MPTSYASLAQWNLHLSARRVARQVDANAVDIDTLSQQILDATSGLIDTAAIEGGYDVPLIPADLTNDADLQARIDAILVMKNITMATVFLLQPIDETNKIEKAREVCADWLDALAMGRGLPIVQTPANDSLRLVVADGTRPFSPLTMGCLRAASVSEGTGFGRGRFGFN